VSRSTIETFSEDLSTSWCSIPSREVSILWSYLDITLLFSSYVYLIILGKQWFLKVKPTVEKEMILILITGIFTVGLTVHLFGFKNIFSITSKKL
jgi:hypothetical protein